MSIIKDSDNELEIVYDGQYVLTLTGVTKESAEALKREWETTEGLQVSAISTKTRAVGEDDRAYDSNEPSTWELPYDSTINSVVINGFNLIKLPDNTEITLGEDTSTRVITINQVPLRDQDTVMSPREPTQVNEDKNRYSLPKGAPRPTVTYKGISTRPRWDILDSYSPDAEETGK